MKVKAIRELSGKYGAKQGKLHEMLQERNRMPLIQGVPLVRVTQLACKWNNHNNSEMSEFIVDNSRFRRNPPIFIA